MKKSEIQINAIIAKKINSADTAKITAIDTETQTVELNGEKTLKIATIVSHYNFVEMYVEVNDMVGLLNSDEEIQRALENESYNTMDEEEVKAIDEVLENGSVEDMEDKLHDFQEAGKTAKTSNDVLLQALAEVLRGAKKADVCRKYNIPTYRFSRVLNFKYGRPSYRAVVYDMCKQYDKLDWIKNIELYEEA